MLFGIIRNMKILLFGCVLKVERFNNAVHFGAEGSRQVGDMLAAWLQCNWDNL